MKEARNVSPGRSPRFYEGLSIVAAFVTIALRAGAYLLTGSVGLFSDAAESLVNLVAAAGALWALTLAARPTKSTPTATRGPSTSPARWRAS